MLSTDLRSFLCCLPMFSGQLEPAETLFSSFIYQYHKTQHSRLFTTALVKWEAQQLDHVRLAKVIVFCFSLVLRIFCFSAFHGGAMAEEGTFLSLK